MIKIAHYSTAFLPVTQNWIYNQVSNLEKLDDIEVIFYSFIRLNRNEFQLKQLRYVTNNNFNLPFDIRNIWHLHSHWSPHYLFWMLKDQPKIFHAHHGTNGYQMLPYTRLLKIPLITSFYGTEAYKDLMLAPIWNKKYSKLFKYGQIFLVEGPFMRKRLIELGCPTNKAVIHHIGIDVNKYKYKARRPDGEVKMLISGRFVEKKGIPFAIEAFSRILGRLNGKATLTIVGDSDGNGTMTREKRIIFNTIKKNNVEERVKLLGFVKPEDLQNIALEHHIFLCPSFHASDGDAEGGFPVSITEMLATGMPVMASDHCDIPHIVQDGKSGFVAPEKDINKYSEKLEYLIKHPELWPKMGKYGRKHVENNYDIRNLNDSLLKIYNRSINI